jgi:hypothetical protein
MMPPERERERERERQPRGGWNTLLALLTKSDCLQLIDATRTMQEKIITVCNHKMNQLNKQIITKGDYFAIPHTCKLATTRCNQKPSHYQPK